eukprot:COSAG05_NODE_2080_length_3601_cov_1.988007_3_plen_71_part_00
MVSSVLKSEAGGKRRTKDKAPGFVRHDIRPFLRRDSVDRGHRQSEADSLRAVLESVQRVDDLFATCSKNT